MKIRTRLALLAAPLLLAGCGGGDAPATATPTPTPAPTPSPTPTPTPAPTPTPSTYHGYTVAASARATTGPALPVGKCINMGNQLEAPNEGDLGRAIRDSDFDTIKAQGFSTVRVPIRWSGHAAATAPYTIEAAFMSRVQHVVNRASSAGLNVIIDMHAYDEMNSDPDGQRDRFVALWRQIASAFSNAPAGVWFELLNEPNNRLNNSNLLSIMTPALAAIRATNATRPVIIGGENTSGIASLDALPLPNDPYVVPTFHYYDPIAFTHQGAAWITPIWPIGATFGSSTDYAQLNSGLRRAQDYMARTGRVPFIGEYGAYDIISLSQRAEYYGSVSHAFASIGIQSCAWSYMNTFQLRTDSGGWITELTSVIGTVTDR